MFNPVKTVQTVSDFTASLKGLIETSHPFVSLQGEVSNLRIPYSGHMYFILKDDKAQIRAVLFKGQRRFLSHDLEDGQQIICKGRISVYEPRGEYQIIIDSVEKDGLGAMHLQYDKLKKRLAEEGLFAEEIKKKLPPLPQKICLITSKSGAAVHDFLKIALDRSPRLEVEIMATPMQGEQAPRAIVSALEKMNKRNWADLIILCRGGGSIEDLWAFNDEDVARTIASSTIPVVSAIGHETDFTIADFVADLRAPTPTAAAHLVVPDIRRLKDTIKAIYQRLHQATDQRINQYQQQLQRHCANLQEPRLLLDQYQMKIDYLVVQLQLTCANQIPRKKAILSDLQHRLKAVSPEAIVAQQENRAKELQTRLLLAQDNFLKQHQQTLQKQALILNALSPLAVLGRGYSLSTNKKTATLLCSVKDVQIGDPLSIQLNDGIIEATATAVKDKA